MISRAALKRIPGARRAAQFLRYLGHKPKLALAAVADRRRSGDEGPLPSAKLRYRVHGGLRAEDFVKAGENIARDLDRMLAPMGRTVYSFEDVLDFGCGSGRVLRNFASPPPSCRIHGTDIDPELVAWCRDNLPWARFTLNNPTPPSPFADASFDFIYSISVFTHLDEEYQHAWLAELKRIARPGAILVLTVHGEHVYRQLPPDDLAKLEAHGFLFAVGATGKLKLDGLPDFYQSAYHTRAYVEREWARYFELVDYVPRGVQDHQDAVVLRRVAD
ncbi:MAG: hypothetical protein QOI38_279 [Sphingomonadales bacterium]|jgi:SAM-dependent methyltransferase|nr:hypothetical protein [Sphingomonadales bacterium]